MEPWTEPTVQWRTGVDSIAQQRDLSERGDLLINWPPLPFETTPTDCYKVGGEFWIWQVGVGGISFTADDSRLVAYPSADVERAQFESLLTRSWLPAMYYLWGRQVLHASAAVWVATGAVVAFAGPSRAGKSTLAYGLGQREGWRLLCDDTLAFSTTRDVDAIQLHPLRNSSRLRPESARYYGRADHPSESIDWPGQSLRLHEVFFIAAIEGEQQPPRIERLRANESYPLLLQQAHAMTLKIAEHNQQLMRDYLQLAATIPMSRLTYVKSFDGFERVLDALEQYLRPPLSVEAGRTPDPMCPPALSV